MEHVLMEFFDEEIKGNPITPELIDLFVNGIYSFKSIY